MHCWLGKQGTKQNSCENTCMSNITLWNYSKFMLSTDLNSASYWYNLFPASTAHQQTALRRTWTRVVFFSYCLLLLSNCSCCWPSHRWCSWWQCPLSRIYSTKVTRIYICCIWKMLLFHVIKRPFVPRPTHCMTSLTLEMSRQYVVPKPIKRAGSYW